MTLSNSFSTCALALLSRLCCESSLLLQVCGCETNMFFPMIRLMTDSAFCLDLMARVCKAGAAIEDALGSAQDIEGAVEEDGAITVVQTRPQM